MRGVASPALALRLALALLLAAGGVALAGAFSVELRAPRYAPRDGSALLHCEHSVAWDLLHKVEWLRDSKRIFQFVRNRRPPFRAFPEMLPGATIDRNNSNYSQVLLKDLDLEASGYYSCEVSTQAPIFTKTSNDEELTVFIPQRGPPRLHIARTQYLPGEVVEANCTSRPAHPVPHLTWLLNGKTVPDSYLRFFPAPARGLGHVSTATVQLTLRLAEPTADAYAAAAAVEAAAAAAEAREVAEAAEAGEAAIAAKAALAPMLSIRLACVATLPHFKGAAAPPHLYADHEMEEMTVQVLLPSPQPPASRAPVGLLSGSPRLAAAAAVVAASATVALSWLR